MKKIKKIFEDKKKRYWIMMLCILPFFVAICLFGFITFKEVKNVISLISNQEVKDEYKINDGDYVLRDNATDYQMELFTELKGMLEGTSEHTDIELVESICKNYVADFYTWSNKVGQYDVGGLYYVYSPQKSTIFIQARDGFYQYLNEYINTYSASNLLEVISVEASGKSMSENYVVDENTSFTAYEVTCNWTYKESDVFSTSKYISEQTFIVANNNGRYEIVEVKE